MIKIISYILTVFFIGFQVLLNNIYSQTGDLDKLISIKVKDMPIGEVLNEIMKKGQIKFSYSNEQIPVDTRISLDITEQPLRTVLDMVFKNQNVEYEIVEKQIILRKIKSGD